jgi:hypothetical protein
MRQALRARAFDRDLIRGEHYGVGMRVRFCIRFPHFRNAHSGKWPNLAIVMDYIIWI